MKTPWEIELIKPEQKWEITLSNKVSYVLPIASPEQLGGVKPDSKTSDMDIPVAVDEEGKLWTKDKIDETLSIKGFSADAEVVGKELANKIDKTDIATDDEILELLAELDVLPAVTDTDGSILADENENVLLW